ncbi:unnamed protein product [Rotaria sp. Silwood1]|nr:unnamed protein product [Rotaria sp. Silwood1]CAF3655757.1 unnamed protein product [Rotaria sp. Silwood1]CAF5020327.1 unnamed protein product [Rotaria sp. Silwood1]CAF5085201.1 unnamed protein product [Rotaria sp. Silwood1]
MISSLSSRPLSIIGSIQHSPEIYSSLHNQSCSACQYSRYEQCSNVCQCPLNTYWNQGICMNQLFENQTCTQANACRKDLNLTCAQNCNNGTYTQCVPIINNQPCQCPSLTYWNGSMCVNKSLENQTCSQLDACRDDLNLTCATNCYGSFTTCVKKKISNGSSMSIGITVAGYCNCSSGNTSDTLHSPNGIFLFDNGTLYVLDTFNNRVQMFSSVGIDRIGQTLISNLTIYTSWLYADSSTLYVAIFQSNYILFWPSMATIPPVSRSSTCSFTTISSPMGIAVDRSGNNIYIVNQYCHRVIVWSRNSTNATQILVGTGIAGNNSDQLNNPYGLYFDEDHSLLYVADRGNHRIQLFNLTSNNSNIGITVAGGNGPGVAMNQLQSPNGVWVSRIDGTVYVADTGNHRIQAWSVNATTGITVAGNSAGLMGTNASELRTPWSIVLDQNDNNLYVSDTGNHRIQRFSLR